jgi:phospholipase C
MFLTYDEHGGLYDHVPPPVACAPDKIAPILGPADTTQAGFDRYGVRVPMTVISPYARPAFVSHVVHDHTSVTRFIETRFSLPALSARDANADPMLEFFDFSNPAFMTPPRNLTAPAIDPAGLAFCVQTYMNVPTSP